MNVYLYPSNTETELKNAYIGEYTKLAYWKFDNNLIDETGNTTATGVNISYGTIGSKHYVQNTATGSNSYISVSGNLLSKIGTGDFTVSLWVYLPSMSGNNLPYLFGEWYDAASPRPGIVLRYFISSKRFGVYITSDGYSSIHSTFNRWYHVCTTRVNGYVSLYIDGVSELTPYQDTTDLSIGSSPVFFLNGRTGYAEGTRPVTGGKISEVIYDSKGWSSSEVSSYFTSLKSNYGL